MRIRSLITVLVAGALLAACSSMVTVEGTVALAPGERAEARFDASSGALIRLDNEGPGRADCLTRIMNGDKRPVVTENELRESGPFTYRLRGLKSPGTVVMDVVLEAYEDAGTTVKYRLSTPDGQDLDWNVSR